MTKTETLEVLKMLQFNLGSCSKLDLAQAIYMLNQVNSIISFLVKELDNDTIRNS